MDKRIESIQNQIKKGDCGKNCVEKWWCMGDIVNSRWPVSLNEINGTTTDKESRTNKPPVIANTISCLVIIPIAPNEPPNERDPVSPINILAGGALNHKKPKQAPIIELQKIDISPVPSIYNIWR